MVNYVPRGANARALAAAVAAHATAHPPQPGQPGGNATDAQVASAIAAWMSTHPAATDTQVAAAVANYIAAHPAVTEVQLAAAVATYMQAHPPAAGPSALVTLGNVAITQTAVLAIVAGVRSVTVAVAGAVVGDALVLTPTSGMPEGYAVHNAIVTAANTVRVTLTAPLLAIGASYSIICRVSALR